MRSGPTDFAMLHWHFALATTPFAYTVILCATHLQLVAAPSNVALELRLLVQSRDFLPQRLARGTVETENIRLLLHDMMIKIITRKGAAAFN